MRSLKSLNSFSPGSATGVPKGICAISCQASGRCHVLRTSSSIKGSTQTFIFEHSPDDQLMHGRSLLRPRREIILIGRELFL